MRRRLAGRYIAGMTPGYRIGHGLGGNVNGLSRAEVNRWRNGYVAERARIGVSGFGEFHFVFENSRASSCRTRHVQWPAAWAPLTRSREFSAARAADIRNRFP